jgi:hypothetical protein
MEGRKKERREERREERTVKKRRVGIGINGLYCIVMLY